MDITSMRTSDLRIISGSLLVAHSQTRGKLILDFLAITFLSSISSVVFSRIYWIIAELEAQVCLSCKTTPDASAVSESGEEGDQNPKSVDQLCN